MTGGDQGGTQESNQGHSWNWALQRERNLPWDLSSPLQADFFLRAGGEPGFGVLWTPSNGERKPHSHERGSLHPSVHL